MLSKRNRLNQIKISITNSIETNQKTTKSKKIFLKTSTRRKIKMFENQNFFENENMTTKKNYFELICFICHKSKHITSNCLNKKNNNKKFKIVVVATKKKQIFDEFDLIDKNKRKLKIEKIIKIKKNVAKCFKKKRRLFC